MSTADSSTASARPSEASTGLPVSGVHHFSLTVSNLDVSLPWYERTLGLIKIMDEGHPGGRAVILMHPSGQLFVGLHAHDENAGERFHEIRTGLDHVSFGVPSRADLEAWEARLRDLGVTYSPIYERSYGSLLVFRDPDNIQLEFISPAPQG